MHPKLKPTFQSRLWALGLLLASFSCSSPCQNEIIIQALSPSGRQKAIVFQRDCGATTGFSTQVSILGSNESLPNASGNAFTSDSDHGKAVSGRGGGPIVFVRWLSESEIEISYDSKARIFSKESSANSVKIRYSSLPSHGA
jgi:hypothetical protein